MARQSQPIFNIPHSVALMALLHILFFIPYALNIHTLARMLFAHLAFVPLRYYSEIYASDNIFATLFSPIGYSLLHADWVHLLVNLGMMIAFGKIIVLICGVRVFFVLYLLGALAGSGIVLAFSQYPQFPLVGASASISALIGAIACLGIMQQHQMPPPFDTKKRSMQCLLLWIGINLLMALLPHETFASGFAIAWNAHLAGLFVGYVYAWFKLRKP